MHYLQNMIKIVIKKKNKCIYVYEVNKMLEHLYN